MKNNQTEVRSQKSGVRRLLLTAVAACSLSLASAHAAVAVPVNAQTNTSGIGVSTGPILEPTITLNGVPGDLEAAALDLYNDAKTAEPYALTNGAATFRFGGGINTSDKHIVLAGMLTVPMTNNVNLGVIVAHVGNQWFEGGANVSYGLTKAYPVIGKATIAAGDGVVYNFISRAPANYVFTDLYKEWTINPQWKLGGGVTLANTSDRAGVDLLAGLHVTWEWGAK